MRLVVTDARAKWFLHEEVVTLSADKHSKEVRMVDDNYPDLNRFSKSRGVSPDKLIKAFEIEKSFHDQLLSEESFEKRQNMYEEVYRTVHAIYGKSSSNILEGKNPKDGIVRLFRRELEGKSVLDVGCGEGYFLASVAKQMSHGQLMGLDVSIPSLSMQHPDIRFISGNIIDFDLDQTFDVIFCDQVLEHIAPADQEIFLESVKRSLKKDGLFIVNLPNSLFGPGDITRIMDFSYSGKIRAQGTHLNESTYTELIPVLVKHGFGNFKTPIPIPKLRRLLPDFRMTPSSLVFVENNKFVLSAFRSIKRSGQCVARFSVTLICAVV